MLTCIFAVVLGSRNDLTVFHKSLNPDPALMMYIRQRVYSEEDDQNEKLKTTIICKMEENREA